MSGVEWVLNVTYLYLIHAKAWPLATVIGFSSALVSLAGGTLYYAQEYFCGYCAAGHNYIWDAFLFWILPNGYVLALG